MALQRKARLGVACAAALALTGCVAGSGAPGAGETADTAPAGAFSPVSVERDVEAPEVFSLSGQGLWDGRPSLGGVWVAHTSVKDPERVIIRNAKNGKSVVGALFRRERELPGPGLQVSSDAAEALGLLAGQPGELSVVALRREEKPVPPDAEIGATDEIVAESAAAETAAAETAVEQTAVADTAAAETAAADTATAETAVADTATAETAAAETVDAAAAKPRGLFGFLKKKPKPEAAAVATGAGAGAIEQTALDPLAETAAAAIDRAEASGAAPASLAPPAAEPATLRRGYIQIGIFSVEANAERAAGQMTAAGMAATVRSDQSNGKTYWRVIVGPAASVAERDALVARVKGIGYPDAYPVSN